MTFDMINSQALDFHMLQHGLGFCVCVKEDTESAKTLFQSRKKISKTQENKKNWGKMITVHATKVVNSLNKSFMKFRGPTHTSLSCSTGVVVAVWGYCPNKRWQFNTRRRLLLQGNLGLHSWFMDLKQYATLKKKKKKTHTQFICERSIKVKKTKKEREEVN